MTKAIYAPVYQRMTGQLKAARKRLGLSQTEAARRVGRSRQWLQKIEAPEVRLDVFCLVRLCRVYRISAEKLIRQLAAESPDEGGSFYWSERGADRVIRLQIWGSDLPILTALTCCS
jgi:transcriptional regulator with XRE-family HTH domain